MRMMGTIQLQLAFPVMLYSSISARCICGDTISLNKAGYWKHPTGPYCRGR